MKMYREDSVKKLNQQIAYLEKALGEACGDTTCLECDLTNSDCRIRNDNDLRLNCVQVHIVWAKQELEAERGGNMSDPAYEAMQLLENNMIWQKECQEKNRQREQRIQILERALDIIDSYDMDSEKTKWIELAEWEIKKENNQKGGEK